MDSARDIARKVQAQFPGARVDYVKPVSRAQMEHERKQVDKRSDEKKRLADCSSGDGSFLKNRMKHRPDLRGRDDAPEPDELDLVDELDVNGKRLVCRVCMSNNGTFREVRWVRRGTKAVHAKRRKWDSDAVCVLNVTSEKPSPDEIPPYPQVYYKNTEASRLRAVTRLRYRFEAASKRHLGGMEITNEHLGAQMVQHGDPALKKELFQRGVLQVRKDENGNPQTYMVAGSRKQQAERIKEYNRRQAEAQARGWKGTHSSHGTTVKFLRHGGITPE